MSNDWIPSRRQDQLAFFRNFLQKLSANKTEWGIPAETITKLGTLFGDAQAALTAAEKADRTKSDGVRVRVTFGELIDYGRDIKRRYLYMPPLTLPDYSELFLKEPDTTPTHVGNPTTPVYVEVGYHHKNSLLLHIKPMSGFSYDSRADWGFRVHYGVLPQKPVSEEISIERQYLTRKPERPEELRHSHFTRRKKDVIDFDYDCSGMECHLCVRYENGKGDHGPWGPMISAFIP